VVVEQSDQNRRNFNRLLTPDLPVTAAGFCKPMLRRCFGQDFWLDNDSIIGHMLSTPMHRQGAWAFTAAGRRRHFFFSLFFCFWVQ